MVMWSRTHGERDLNRPRRCGERGDRSSGVFSDTDNERNVSDERNACHDSASFPPRRVICNHQATSNGR